MIKFVNDERTKGVSKSRDQRTDNDLHKIHRKLKIRHHEPTHKTEVKPEGQAAPAPLMTAMVLLLFTI